MAGADRYRYADTHVVHDDFGDEVVIINLKSGVYFSLLGVARSIWTLVGREPNLNEVVEGVSREYEGDPPTMGASVGDFLDELVQEELINIFQRDDAGGKGGGSEGNTGLAGTERIPFQQPVMARHEDQQELLLLDPIHEVSDLGWPHKKEGFSD